MTETIKKEKKTHNNKKIMQRERWPDVARETKQLQNTLPSH